MPIDVKVQIIGKSMLVETAGLVKAPSARRHGRAAPHAYGQNRTLAALAVLKGVPVCVARLSGAYSGGRVHVADSLFTKPYVVPALGDISIPVDDKGVFHVRSAKAPDGIRQAVGRESLFVQEAHEFEVAIGESLRRKATLGDGIAGFPQSLPIKRR